jgi:hypothetical protein
MVARFGVTLDAAGRTQCRSSRQGVAPIATIGKFEILVVPLPLSAPTIMKLDSAARLIEPRPPSGTSGHRRRWSH